MPQLNPAPWFSILILSWLVFLAVIPPKVINHSFPNEPVSRTGDAMKPHSWTWPWS
uniref:ATP synthase F0 subunit 8 n=1 Tax=Synodus foetens TaxID=399151 RepID=UPI0028D46126|nr:ATP synthase F0 subunit 8 [Synodus foetens]WMY89984.1 ATP synthase F0 subunit 8 [Synodus foetens]